ncbi:MAG TPA: hypothetical protein VMB84_15310, partial [Stellaceae bacterium]|nr:hypothetical protein [Stellaceae bacterium]
MTTAPDDMLIIENGTLIDGTGAPPRPNRRIVIRGGRIAELDGGGDRAAEAPAARTIDAAGGFILPGLIDGHVHISMFQGSPPGIRYPSSAEYA